MILERKALEWLARNEKGLTNYFDGMYGPNCDEIKELREMIQEFKRFANNATAQDFLDRRIFLVCFETSNKLPAPVVSNYLQRAMKRYAKHDDQQAFSGIVEPRFYLQEVPMGGDEQHALVSIVGQIKYARDFLNPFFNKIEVV